jgi:hypothetical protein
MIEQKSARFPQSSMFIGAIAPDAVPLPYSNAEIAETSLQLLLSHLSESSVGLSLTGKSARVDLLELLNVG